MSQWAQLHVGQLLASNCLTVSRAHRFLPSLQTRAHVLFDWSQPKPLRPMSRFECLYNTLASYIQPNITYRWRRNDEKRVEMRRELDASRVGHWAADRSKQGGTREDRTELRSAWARSWTSASSRPTQTRPSITAIVAGTAPASRTHCSTASAVSRFAGYGCETGKREGQNERLGSSQGTVSS